MTPGEFTGTIGIWLPGIAALVGVLTFLVALGTLLSNRAIARRQRETQTQVAELQRSSQEKIATDSLAHQRDVLQAQQLASRRVAAAHIASNRQAWINDMRNDMAVFISTWQDIAFHMENFAEEHLADPKTLNDWAEFSRPMGDKRQRAHEVEVRIAIRLNYTEEDHQTLLLQMSHMKSLCDRLRLQPDQRPPADTMQEYRFTQALAILQMQKILKAEWTRLKGEIYVDPLVEDSPLPILGAAQDKAPTS